MVEAGGRPKAGRHRPMIHRERHTETLRDTERKREERDASRQREIEITWYSFHPTDYFYGQ